MESFSVRVLRVTALAFLRALAFSDLWKACIVIVCGGLVGGEGGAVRWGCGERELEGGRWVDAFRECGLARGMTRGT